MEWIIALVILIALVLLIYLLKPKDVGGEYDPYFANLNSALKEAGIGTARILIDLDRLDRNIATIQANIPSDSHYRIVVKSIPCVDLIRTIRVKVKTNKFMLVHRPFIKVILDNFDPGIDILIGKPLPVFALDEFFQEIQKTQSERAQAEVQWLIDTSAHLNEYLQYAIQNKLRLRVNLEIDIGLHRGGASNNHDLQQLFDIIHHNPDHLIFSGFMGYEGHVPHAPGIFSSPRNAALKEFADNLSVYKSFIDFGRENYPDLFKGDFTFNCGGSGTYSLFNDYSFITDIGIGGAVLRPAGYPAHFLKELIPAEFIATPVLKKRSGAVIPFIEGFSGLISWWNPNYQNSLEIYGGGWAGNFVAPKGVFSNPLLTDPPNQNLVPNQSTINVSSRTTLEIGDYVFYHPIQSDAMFQFEDIVLISGEKVNGVWNVFDRRY
jgi:D-serine deaminase-like pyridoxal phosphate-dependent protein